MQEQNSTKATITPSEFQEICDEAVLAVDLQSWQANAAPHEIAGALITEVQKGVFRRAGEACREKAPTRSNEELIDEIVTLMSRHWSGPIRVGRTINESIRMVLQHWRERHGLRWNVE
jgi:hypothetical protein